MFPAVGGVDRLDDSNVRKVFARICTAAKVRPRSPHDLRDTFASQLLSANAPLLYVSQQLGHGSAAVTLKLYARWLPKNNSRYVYLLDGNWESTGSQPSETDPAGDRKISEISKEIMVDQNSASWNQIVALVRHLNE